MKLHPDQPSVLNTVTAYGEGFVEVNATRYESPLLVSPEAPTQVWPVAGFEALQEADFAPILALAPDVVLLGTGARQRFPHPGLTRALMTARIGVEFMDTRAACRTYNILMAEGRRVVAALLPG